MILITKLSSPQPRSRSVERSRLIGFMNAGLREEGHKLTLVTGPAGFGKSTLVALWLAQLDRPHSWVALDPTDSNVRQFFTYLIEATGRLSSNWGRSVQPLLQDSQPLDPNTLITLLSNSIAASPAPGVLVLDDYQFVQFEAIHEALAYWLEHLPPDFHLVVISRSRPPIGLARLRARGEVTEISTTDLRFSEAEAQQFLLETMELKLEDSEIQFLSDRTEGWAAGLQLAALTLKQSPPGSKAADSLTGRQRHVWDFLLREVFERQPTEVQQFLSATAILSRLSAPLCDAVTGRDNGREMLSRLESDNIFLIALDQERSWYRYHQLFEEFLRARQNTAASQVQTWHRRASTWYADQGLVELSIEHGLASEDYRWASTLILKAADDLWTRGRNALLQAWILAVPREVRDQEPLLDLYHAWTLFFGGRHDAIPPILAGVGHQVAHSDPSPQDAISGILSAIRCALASSKGDTAATLMHGRRALSALPPDRGVWRSVVGLSLGEAYRQNRQPAEAQEAYRSASQLAEEAGNLSGALYGIGSLADLYRETLEIPSARETLTWALHLLERYQAEDSPIAGPIYAALGEVLLLEGDVETAEQYLRTGLALCEAGGFPRLETYNLLASHLEERDQHTEAAALRARAVQMQRRRWPPAENTVSADRALQQQIADASTEGLLEPLSEREVEVLRLIGDGKSNKAIADELVLAVSTVKWHINNIYGKLGVRSRTQAIARARELFLLGP